MKPVAFGCHVEITKAVEEEGRWIVEGFAATSDFDLQDDVITDEAIRGSARDLVENSTVLLNHNANEPIGKVLASEAREGGLFLKILVSKTAPAIWQKIREGVLNKFSVRGRILAARKQWMPKLHRFARMILKMHLLEVSLVSVPANPKARALGWYVEKALDEFEKTGGTIDVTQSDPPQGDETMDDDVVIEEELIEASGEPDGDTESNEDASASDTPPGQKTDGEDEDTPPADGTDIEKAGRKISTARLSKLKKLLDELKSLIEEVEGASDDGKSVGDAPGDKRTDIETTVAAIAKSLGLDGEVTGKDVPSLTSTIENLSKRVAALEGVPGQRTSLDGQEQLPGEGKPSLWKGLV